MAPGSRQAPPASPPFATRVSSPPVTTTWCWTSSQETPRSVPSASNEETTDNCAEATKRIWVWDNVNEQSPKPIFPAPLPADADSLCLAGGRFGAHNIWENRPGPLAFHTERLVLGSFFNGAVRLYDTCDARHPAELASFTPAAPPDSPAGTIQINHVYWDGAGGVLAARCRGNDSAPPSVTLR